MKTAYICRACQARLRTSLNSLSAATSIRYNYSNYNYTHPTPRQYTTTQHHRSSLSQFANNGISQDPSLASMHFSHTAAAASTSVDRGKTQRPGLATRRKSSSRTSSNRKRIATSHSHQRSQVASGFANNDIFSAITSTRPTNHRRQRTVTTRNSTWNGHIKFNRTKYKPTKSGIWTRRQDYVERIKKKGKRRALQWSKVRSLDIPKDQIPSIRRAFNKWKSRYRLISLHKRLQCGSSKRMWLRDGEWMWRLRDVDSMRESWTALSIKERRQQWPTLMMSTLLRRPILAHRVLLATLDPSCSPPGYAISDSLLVIAKFLITAKSIRKGAQYRPYPDEIHDLLYHVIPLASRQPSDILLDQRTLGIFASRLPQRHALSLYELLESSIIRLHPHTALQFARKLAGEVGLSNQAPYKQKAVQILVQLSIHGMDLNTPIPQSVVTPLLHYKRSGSEEDDDSNSFDHKDALASLWDRGFRPNVINLTAYMDTSCLEGDFAYAIHVANLFVDEGLTLDKRTLDVLFRAAKNSLNVDNVSSVLKLAQKSGIKFFSNPLHAVFFFSQCEMHAKRQHQQEQYQQHQQTPSKNLRPFLPMLRLYKKFTSLEALQNLIPDSLDLLLTQDATTTTQNYPTTWEFEHSIVPIVDEFFSPVNNPLDKSNNNNTDWQALATMFRAYIYSLNTPYELIMLWIYFKTLLEQQPSSTNVATQLVRSVGSLIHDTFIHCMLLQQGLARPALEIFADMLRFNIDTKPKHQNANNNNNDDDDNIAPIHPAPSIFTFCIIINGLAKTGKASMTEQIFKIMQEHNIKPNLPIFNARVKAASLSQNVNKVVLTMQELEAASFQPDEYTFRAFARLNNQEEALAKIQTVIEENERSMEQERLAEWFAERRMSSSHGLMSDVLPSSTAAF